MQQTVFLASNANLMTRLICFVEKRSLLSHPWCSPRISMSQVHSLIWMQHKSAAVQIVGRKQVEIPTTYGCLFLFKSTTCCPLAWCFGFLFCFVLKCNSYLSSVKGRTESSRKQNSGLLTYVYWQTLWTSKPGDNLISLFIGIYP